MAKRRSAAGPLSGITSIKKVTIPDSVIYIWDYAFEERSGLETVDMPDSLSYWGIRVFRMRKSYRYYNSGRCKDDQGKVRFRNAAVLQI